MIGNGALSATKTQPVDNMTTASYLRAIAESERPKDGWCVRTEPFKDQMLVAVATESFALVLAVPQVAWDGVRAAELLHAVA